MKDPGHSRAQLRQANATGAFFPFPCFKPKMVYKLTRSGGTALPPLGRPVILCNVGQLA